MPLAGSRTAVQQRSTAQRADAAYPGRAARLGTDVRTDECHTLVFCSAGPDAAGPSHRPAADQGDCETGLDPLHVLAALKRLKGQTKGWLSTAVGLAEQAICQAYLASLQGPGAGSKGDDDGAKKQKKKRLAEGHARNDKHQDSEDQSADTREETARREKKAAKKAKKVSAPPLAYAVCHIRVDD